MFDSLQGKIACVTGAATGIGRAIALTLARYGVQIILCAKTEGELESLRDEINEYNNAIPICVGYDLSDYDQIKSGFAKIQKAVKKLDILVNNAGILDDAILGMITSDQVRKTFSVNTEAVIYHMQYASRFMVRNTYGSIINISSIVGRVGNIGQTVYAASKAGVIGATLSAAKELAHLNIRVNAVAPGFIDTDLTRQLPKKIYLERLNSIKMGQRAGKPEDVANVVLFLASEMSSYVTGQIIGVDGGMIV